MSTKIIFHPDTGTVIPLDEVLVVDLKDVATVYYGTEGEANSYMLTEVSEALDSEDSATGEIAVRVGNKPVLAPVETRSDVRAVMTKTQMAEFMGLSVEDQSRYYEHRILYVSSHTEAIDSLTMPQD